MSSHKFIISTFAVIAVVAGIWWGSSSGFTPDTSRNTATSSGSLADKLGRTPPGASSGTLAKSPSATTDAMHADSPELEVKARVINTEGFGAAGHFHASCFKLKCRVDANGDSGCLASFLRDRGDTIQLAFRFNIYDDVTVDREFQVLAGFGRSCDTYC